MYIDRFTLGSDPELFIIDTTTGKVVSSIGLIPGVKDDPYRAEDMPEGFGMETDNILAEFNIPPCTTIEEWINNIEYMKEYIRHFVKRINPNYDIKCSAYEDVDADQLNSEEACEFGCMPDFNVYTMSQNEAPDGSRATGRGAGFHLHIGYPSNNIDSSMQLIRYFDAYIGLTSLLFDTEARRRKYYGKAGCFRLVPYGYEYRTLSSAMMASRDRLEFVYKQVIRAINAFNHGFSIPEYTSTQKAINNCDVKLAKKLMADYELVDKAFLK